MLVAGANALPDGWEQMLADAAHFWEIAPASLWNATWSDVEWHLIEAKRILSAKPKNG
ncbi:hypothetical protein [Paraburkholderia largidicola]|uniref:Uncharacterized protein n=1 Tax=Paraburkholderia largidicola TaxID=3014751 RepID=A0A7I8BK38_9BURK|nr:hypothetical protein [Paraburkholderia sp. PGU16]BCF88669.1 hypothetical protein PPGU16_17360 [Paraburkholderia sp. PGU16]